MMSLVLAFHEQTTYYIHKRYYCYAIFHRMRLTRGFSILYISVLFFESHHYKY